MSLDELLVARILPKRIQKEIEMNGRMLALLFTLLVFASVAIGQEPDDAQRAKALGLALDLSLDKTKGAAVGDEVKARLADTIAGTDGGRCMFPDHPDPELAFAELPEIQAGLDMDLKDCRALRFCHRALLAGLTHEGKSYPKGCHPDWPDDHAVVLWVNKDSFNAVSRAPPTDAHFQKLIDAKVWGPSGGPNGRPFTLDEMREQWGGRPGYELMIDFTVETARRIGVILIPKLVHGDQLPLIHALSRRIGGAIGVGWFPGSTCSSHVEFHIGSNYNGGLLDQLGLWLHECGHCLQGPHTFFDQERTQAVLSYRYGRHTPVGYSTGDAVYGLPIDPSMALWVVLYGGKPRGKPWRGMFEDIVPPPPKPPTTGGAKHKLGDKIYQHDSGWVYEFTVTGVTGDEGSTLAEKVKAALDKVKDYPRKDDHRSWLAGIYEGSGKGVEQGAVTVEQAHRSAKIFRTWIIGNEALAEWSEVLELADAVTTADGFASIARGLGGSVGLRLTPEDIAAALARAQAGALPPEVLVFIKLLIPFLPQEIQFVVRLIVAILEALPVEEEADHVEIVMTERKHIYHHRKAAWRPFGFLSIAL